MVLMRRRTKGLLRDEAYRDPSNVTARQSLWCNLEEPPDPFWRLSFVDWTGNEMVFDVGCGNGLDLGQLAGGGRCAQVVAVDLSEGMLASLSWTSALAVLVVRVQGDAHALPFRDGTADVVLAMHMLYHLADMDAALGDIVRVLKPGGCPGGLDEQRRFDG